MERSDKLVRRVRPAPSLLAAIAAVIFAAPLHAQDVTPPQPLVIGQTFTLNSKILGEGRRINVYTPPVYSDSPAVRLPVLYMPDGGMAEDFLHVAGLVEVTVGDGIMRPFILVGIENTQRRRDLTGPTQNPEDKKIAPKVGGSAEFRAFIRNELMPAIDARYRTTREKAIVGESLAGLFVVETFIKEPDLFDTYMAFDPSLWWNNAELVATSPDILRRRSDRGRTLYLANSSEPVIAGLTAQFVDSLKKDVAPDLDWYYTPLPDETHATIYHPAALLAFRRLLGFDTLAAARKYPKHWFAAIKDANKPDWEILPQAARPGEVILSKRNELGLLSNFAPTPFVFHGVRYASLEGFWQMMLYPEGPDDPRAAYPGVEWKYTRAQVAQMTAFDAKAAGDLAEANMKKMGIKWCTFEGKRMAYRSQTPAEHYALIVAATHEKVRQNANVRQVLLATGDLILRPDHIQEEYAPLEWRYFDILMQIRRELQQ